MSPDATRDRKGTGRKTGKSRGRRLVRFLVGALCGGVVLATGCFTTPPAQAPCPAWVSSRSGLSSPGPVLAFPGAEGAGAWARGGRGGDVYHVRNLADDGPGSLRFGLASAHGPRTIVFEVAGTILLRSDLVIDEPWLTLAGQTAPGGGITLAGRQTRIVDTHDVIVRYLRFRPGDVATAPGRYEPDALSVVGSHDVILDHVSASWSTDEVLSVTHGSHRVTVQWSLIAEALHRADHHKGDHGYGSLVEGGDITFHHNLFAHNRSRNPRPGGSTGRTRLSFVNNVVYNPGNRFAYAGDDDFRMNFVANYGLAGPDTEADLEALFHGGGARNLLYQAHNRLDLDRDGILDGRLVPWRSFAGLFTPVRQPFDLPSVRVEPAEQAFRRVLADAGASLARDEVDARIVRSVAEQSGGHIDSQAQVGGWPELVAGEPAPDRDRDGMSDAWERCRGLDPSDPRDRNTDADGDGATNLEAYLDALTLRAPGGSEPPPPALSLGAGRPVPDGAGETYPIGPW